MKTLKILFALLALVVINTVSVNAKVKTNAVPAKVAGTNMVSTNVIASTSKVNATNSVSSKAKVNVKVKKVQVSYERPPVFTNVIVKAISTNQSPVMDDGHKTWVVPGAKGVAFADIPGVAKQATWYVPPAKDAPYNPETYETKRLEKRLAEEQLRQEIRATRYSGYGYGYGNYGYGGGYNSGYDGYGYGGYNSYDPYYYSYYQYPSYSLSVGFGSHFGTRGSHGRRW